MERHVLEGTVDGCVALGPHSKDAVEHQPSDHDELTSEVDDLTTESEDETDSDETDSDSDDDDDVAEEELDLGGAILKEIREETYVCLVCTMEISPDERFWPCSDCHRVYHISCISSWSSKGSSTDDEGNWKCPACHSTHKKQKFQYKCWCKKTLHPPQNKLTPGSCGQTCGAQLPGCPHKCSLPCHPGPHAECNALGPILKCRCGKHDNQWPCVMTPYEDGWSCDDTCQEFLSCETHKCGKVCHLGLCGKCDEFVESLCYCGRTRDMVKCHLKVPKKSYGKAKADNWIGNFQCSVISPVIYDCGTHSMDRVCQPVQQRAPHCPLSPDVVKTCHCGQTTIEGSRKSCTDPIPTCDNICSKQLPCGHLCQSPCHEGECAPCFQFIQSKCQCGLNSFTVPCKFIHQGNTPSCSRKCTALLSCRRHRCNRVCCVDESLALTRERLRKKGLRNNTVNTQGQNDAFLVEASHVCLQTCNKKLTCGNPDHICHLTCHAGPCPPCLESTNDDLVCHCGATVVMAPIRCGTRLPPCQSQCVRDLACGHPQIPHNCHPDDVQCPKCTHTVEKRCVCGKNKVRALCFQDEAFCADTCGKLLSCQHHCLTPCHKSPCKCLSICGKKKKYCSHVHRGKCHFPARCDDSKPCKEEVVQSCKCGRQKRKLWCNATPSQPSAEETLLPCDVSCVLKEREEKLREAFGLDDSTQATFSLEDLAYSLKCIQIASVQRKWCLNIESLMKEFMSSSKASMSFKPMKREQRGFVHELSDAYGLYSESQDPEPYRSVFVKKQQNSKVPKHSLQEATDAYEKHAAQQKRGRLITPGVSGDGIESLHADYNALIIDDCVTGVTKPDLEDIIVPAFAGRGLGVQLKWLSGDRYLVLPEAFMRMSKGTEDILKDVARQMSERLRTMFLANTAVVVAIDQDYRILKECKENLSIKRSTQKTKENEGENKAGTGTAATKSSVGPETSTVLENLDSNVEKLSIKD